MYKIPRMRPKPSMKDQTASLYAMTEVIDAISERAIAIHIQHQKELEEAKKEAITKAQKKESFFERKFSGGELLLYTMLFGILEVIVIFSVVAKYL